MFSHMDVVWRFVAGLTGFWEIGWELVQPRGLDVTRFLLQCLYEAQEKTSCESVLGRSMVRYTPLSISDSFALGYCIAVSRCPWIVDMLFSPEPELLEMIILGLKSQNEFRGSILSLYAIGPEAMAQFTKMPDQVLQQLAGLFMHFNMSECELDDGALDLLAGVVPTMTSLLILSINVSPPAATY